MESVTNSHIIMTGGTFYILTNTSKDILLKIRRLLTFCGTILTKYFTN